MTDNNPPQLGGVHHISLTVTDLAESIRWYERVFQAARIGVTIPHNGCEETGYAVLLVEPRSGLMFGLHSNTANTGEKFDESLTGLDHVSFSVAGRVALEQWATWLDGLGVPHSGVVDETDPIVYSTVVFRDPDNIQLEFIAVETADTE
ncbi:VOC family protein [Mycobacterium sp. C31M]